jgi:uncharacterized protein (TIGR03083 family)
MEPTVPTLAPSPRQETIAAQDAIGLLRAEIRRTAELTANLKADTPVPTCPGWTAADLVHHVTLLHGWVGRMVATLAPERLRREQSDVRLPDWPVVPAWFTLSGMRLADILAEADPNAPMYSWTPDRRVGFWIRRLLHETTVHRTDLEAALGEESRIEPAVASDAIDELLEILPSAAAFRPSIDDLHGDGETIHLHATDTDGADVPGEWLITLEPHGYRWSHSHVKGAVAVRAPLSDLALFMYGRLRAQDVTVVGDTALLAHWTARAVLS